MVGWNRERSLIAMMLRRAEPASSTSRPLDLTVTSSLFQNRQSLPQSQTASNTSHHSIFPSWSSEDFPLRPYSFGAVLSLDDSQTYREYVLERYGHGQWTELEKKSELRPVDELFRCHPAVVNSHWTHAYADHGQFADTSVINI